MKQKLKTVIILLLLFINYSYAQEKISLDLETAKEYALKYNKTIQNSGLSIKQSQEKLWETIAAGLPQIDATTDYSNAMGAKISIQFNENQPATEIPIKPTSNFKLQVGQLIFNGSYIVGIQTAKLYQQLSEVNYNKTEQDVISQVIESYYLVLMSENALKILNENVKNLDEIYKKTEPMVKVGMMEKVELDQLSVQVSTLKNSVKAAERQYEMTKNMLRLLLGITPETEIELTDELTGLLEASNISGSLIKGFEIENNVDYAMMNVQEKVTEKQIDLQKAAYLPTITGFYSFTHKILKPAFDMSPANIVGMQMNIPVFSSGERRSKVRQAKIDLETTQNSKALLEEQLNIQFKQLQFNLKSALESYDNQKKNVKVSREVYNSYKSKYENGVISSLDLTSADNNYLKAESDYLNSILEVLKAQNQFNKLTGEVIK